MALLRGASCMSVLCFGSTTCVCYNSLRATCRRNQATRARRDSVLELRILHGRCYGARITTLSDPRDYLAR